MYFRTVNLPTWNSHERSNDQAKSNNSTSSASSQSVVHGWSVLGRGILHVDQARLAHLHDSGAEAAATTTTTTGIEIEAKILVQLPSPG